MFSLVKSAAVLGIDAYVVNVECHLGNAQVPRFITVGLPEGWTANDITIFGKAGWNASGCDRLAMVTRPENYVRALGPRHLFVFWNSAHPILVHSSRGKDDAPENVTWSRSGELLAFTAGDIIYVWQPTVGQ